MTVDQVFNALAGYLGSTYVNQFTKFGRTFQVFVQADQPNSALRLDDIDNLSVRNNAGNMVPLGTLIKIKPVAGPVADQPLQSLSVGDHRRHAGARLFERAGDRADGADREAKPLPPHVGYEWSAMSYQEKLVGNQMYLVFAMALLLVYLVLAGQYESWYRPLAVILAVPISLIGPVAALRGAGHRQQSLHPDRHRAADRAVGQERDPDRRVRARTARRTARPIVEAAVEAARARFRPILMTSFAFILGVLPLVLATGAGANARASIGITVFTGMIASTCLAVLFVPSFFVVMQRFEEWLAARSRRRAASAAAK